MWSKYFYFSKCHHIKAKNNSKAKYNSESMWEMMSEL